MSGKERDCRPGLKFSAFPSIDACRPLDLKFRSISLRLSLPLAMAAALLAIAAMLTGCREVGTHSPSNIAQVKSRAAGGDKEGVFHVRGTVTFADSFSDFLIVQDSGEGLRVALPESMARAGVGKLVDITGSYESIGGEIFFQAAQIGTVGQQPLPAPIPIQLDHSRSGAALDRRVSLTGVVQSAVLDRPDLALMTLVSGGAKITLEVVLAGIYDLEYYRDAEVQATGVLTRHPRIEGETQQLLIPDSRDLIVTRRAIPVDRIPITPVHDLLSPAASSSSGHRVRVKGKLIFKSGSDAGIADSTGYIKTQFAENSSRPVAQTVDFAGYLSSDGHEPILDDAAPVFVPSGPHACGGRAACRQVFRTAKSVQKLAPEAARLEAPVELDAVVTFSDPAGFRLFVQDASGGIFVEVEPGEETLLHAGDHVLVHGVTAPGDFAPSVGHGHIQTIGRAPMPTPFTDLEAIFAGRRDSDWVQMAGVVQDAAATRTDVIATVVWGTYAFKAHFTAPLASVRQLIDKRVTLEGACGAIFNLRRQAMGTQLFVPGLAFAKLQGATPTDNRTALRSVGTLLQFSPDIDLAHRVQVQGTVTLASRTGPTWITDANGDGIRIDTHQAIELHEGDFVDAFGFPAASGYSPFLKAGVVHRLHGGPPLKPIATTVDAASRGTEDSQLVQLRGKLIDSTVRYGDRILTFQSGRTVFQAQITADRALPSFHPGSVLLITGICSTVVGGTEGMLVTRGFGLNLRSAADLSIVSDVGWLTFSRLTEIFAFTGLLAIGALCWATLLRKHVRQQTAELIEQSSLLQNAYELSRFQAEHDSLTELPNRMLFATTLQSGIDKARVEGRALALLFIDLNRFKQVNDGLGHMVGDELLKSVTERLRGTLRREQILARIGGDEFAVIVTEFQTLQEVSQIAGRLIETLEQRFEISGSPIYIGASIGISVFPELAGDAIELQKTADLAMYSAKNVNAVSRFAYFTPRMRESPQSSVSLPEVLTGLLPAAPALAPQLG